MTTPSRRRDRRYLIPAALVGMVAVAMVGSTGCDDEPKPGAMVLQPKAVEDPATPAPPIEQPNDTVDDEAGSVGPAYIYIDQQRHDFPSARLRLEPVASDDPAVRRVRAVLFSTAPEDKADNSFYFEMDLQLLADSTDLPAASQPVTTKDLAYADWYYTSAETGKVDSPSGISLAGGPGSSDLQLQPVEVSVTFTPHSASSVVVQLIGDFAKYEAEQGEGEPAMSNVRVQAVLGTQTSAE